jgi:uncharacterized membrane protein
MLACRHQKIHWRSLDGSMQGAAGIEVRNRGAIHFARRANDCCNVRISFQFEVPEPLVPFASLLTPLADNILTESMERFARYAQQRYAEVDGA